MNYDLISILKAMECTLKSPDYASWISAFLTLCASVIALYLGLFGNKETRILIKGVKRELDYLSFEFLAECPVIPPFLTAVKNGGITIGYSAERIAQINSEFHPG
ncbi:MAG: hypothetical protein P4L79_03775 [Legionella sp.]|uniref:hypothetical protein n=1 Tax=Legionella sp. TaxID=459 RepID=UPI0028432C50|nr:hypothetical protein [Legionella sp.]